ncbi:MAG: hypothetical protein RMK65_12600 [Anaerolineae bacterium]|nr:hypothetical protein [Anaerolineae bacterium]
MMDEYSIMWYNVPGAIDGKPLPLGGSKGRNDATARGGRWIREAVKVLGIDTQGATAAIQGYGNAGQFAHILGLEELLGLKVVAVSDSKGGIYNPDGLDPKRGDCRSQGQDGVRRELPRGAKNITNAELLELPVTVLIPAAMEIRSPRPMRGISRPALLPNWPTAPPPRRRTGFLYANGVYVIPDFLCNAGGVTVS